MPCISIQYLWRWIERSNFSFLAFNSESSFILRNRLKQICNKANSATQSMLLYDSACHLYVEFNGYFYFHSPKTFYLLMWSQFWVRLLLLWVFIKFTFNVHNLYRWNILCKRKKKILNNLISLLLILFRLNFEKENTRYFNYFIIDPTLIEILRYGKSI